MKKLFRIRVGLFLVLAVIFFFAGIFVGAGLKERPPSFTMLLVEDGPEKTEIHLLPDKKATSKTYADIFEDLNREIESGLDRDCKFPGGVFYVFVAELNESGVKKIFVMLDGKEIRLVSSRKISDLKSSWARQLFVEESVRNLFLLLDRVADERESRSVAPSRLSAKMAM